MTNNRITKRDLIETINYYNRLYKKTNKTAVKLALSEAYGGYQIVIQQNKPYGSGSWDFTFGHDTARNTLNSFWRRQGYLANSLKHATKSTMEDYRYYKKRR